MLLALGIDYHRFERYFDTELYPSLGLSRGVFFTKEAFGEDRLVTGDPMRMVADDIPPDRMHERAPEAFIADFPVSASARAQLLELYTSTRDPFPELVGGRDDRAPVAGQLPRLRAEGLGARRRGGRHVPGAIARLLRDRHRRRLRVRCDGDRLPGVRGHDARAGSAGRRRDGRAVHLPLPRRERVDRARDRSIADPGGGAGRLDGGPRHGPLRLRDAGRRGRRDAPAPARDRRARAQPRGRGRRRRTCATGGCIGCAPRGRSSPAIT